MSHPIESLKGYPRIQAARMAAEKAIDDAMDDQNLMDWISSEEVYIIPYRVVSHAAGWHLHHIKRNRLYDGATLREAVANAILDREGFIPGHTVATLTGEVNPYPMPVLEAQKRKLI